MSKKKKYFWRGGTEGKVIKVRRARSCGGREEKEEGKGALLIRRQDTIMEWVGSAGGAV